MPLPRHHRPLGPRLRLRRRVLGLARDNQRLLLLGVRQVLCGERVKDSGEHALFGRWAPRIHANRRWRRQRRRRRGGGGRQPREGVCAAGAFFFFSLSLSPRGRGVPKENLPEKTHSVSFHPALSLSLFRLHSVDENADKNRRAARSTTPASTRSAPSSTRNSTETASLPSTRTGGGPAR